MASPTSRTLALLKEEGWTAQVVERWNQYSRTRLDLFGGIDVLAILPEPPNHLICYGGDQPQMDCVHGIMGIQACAGASHAARRTKLLAEKKMALWVASGGRLEVWSWSKKGARGKRKTWEVRRDPILLADFIPAQESAA